MIYPDFLKQGDTIGICAPSDGIGENELKNIRLDSAKTQFNERGFKVRETKSVRRSENGRSTTAEKRAEELMELVKDTDCKAIISACGGDFLFEMLPYLDYEELAAHPTWFQGNSDPTGLCYTLTTIADVASIYSVNVQPFGMKPWDETLEDNFKILQGEILSQKNSEKYQNGWQELTDGYDIYKKDEKTLIKVLDNYSSRNVKIKETGRMLGGCMDVLVQLVGTRFDKTREFINKYREDGIIWYLEIFSMTPEIIASYLWKFREAGWFDNAKAFIFGRPAMVNDEFSVISYEEAIKSQLGPLGKPVIIGADIGHRQPVITVINGAMGRIEAEDGSLRLDMELV
ncbi:MAG: LD-carboxypeptidase [Lachnospiraceae bacterium]|nr:LD-carboxypeptidase [Lachnospiraceae bacterium]